MAPDYLLMLHHEVFLRNLAVWDVVLEDDNSAVDGSHDYCTCRAAKCNRVFESNCLENRGALSAVKAAKEARGMIFAGVVIGTSRLVCQLLA